MSRIWQRIKCFFGWHVWEIVRYQKLAWYRCQSCGENRLNFERTDE